MNKTTNRILKTYRYVGEAINSLPPRECEFFVRHGNGQSYGEIAKDHGLSPARVGVICRRAFNKVKEYVDNRYKYT